MLLCCQADAGCWGGVGGRGGRGVDRSGDVALEAADDLAFAEALGGAAREVGTSRRVVAHPDDGHDVQGAVGVSGAAAAEPVAAVGAAAAGWLGGDTAEFGERGLVADAVWVIACGHQELAGQLDTDAEEADELGGGEGDEGLELAVERLISVSRVFQRR